MKSIIMRHIAIIAPLVLASVNAMADPVSAMNAGTDWVIMIIIAAASIFVIWMAILIAQGRSSIGAVIAAMAGIAVATHPREVAALITS